MNSLKKTIKKILSILIHNKNNNIKDYQLLAWNCKIVCCNFEDEVRVSSNAEISHTKIGYLSSVGRYTKITHSEIGKFCAISWDSTINAISHPYNHLTISAFPYVPHIGHFVVKRKQNYKKVIIKNDVWIGANSVILPGITIGNGAIIGAGCVVTKDVPDYAIVVGVPAKIIKYRFEPEIIKKLLELQWWHLDPKVIKENIDIWQAQFNLDTLHKLEMLCNSSKTV